MPSKLVKEFPTYITNNYFLNHKNILNLIYNIADSMDRFPPLSSSEDSPYELSPRNLTPNSNQLFQTDHPVILTDEDDFLPLPKLRRPITLPPIQGLSERRQSLPPIIRNLGQKWCA